MTSPSASTPGATTPTDHAAESLRLAEGARAVSPASTWSAATADATPELRAEGVRAVISAADEAGVVAYGSFSTGEDSIAVANSAGIRAAERRTSSQLITVHMSPGGG